MSEPATWQLDILDVQTAGRDYCRLHLAAPPEWRSTPGQFVNVRCDPDVALQPARVLDYADDRPRPQLQAAEVRKRTPLVRRPVSISDVGNRSGGGREIVLLLRVVGPASALLARKRPGETIDLVGPLGNGFDLSTPTDRAWLVAGGCGVAPLVGLARDLVTTGKHTTVFYGCADAGDIPLDLGKTPRKPLRPGEPVAGAAEFPGTQLVVATEDGSLGTRGLVTDAMAAHAAEAGWDGVSLFACGPDAMMAAVADLARANGIRRCQVSLENYMGCAIGVCLSCAVKVRADNAQGWTYKLACQDGPVFEADDVIFERTWEGCKR